MDSRNLILRFHFRFLPEALRRRSALAWRISFCSIQSGEEQRVANMSQPDPISDLLKRAKTIAVVGLSASPFRPSYGVSAYMQSHGYRIIPVNPQIQESLGEKSFRSLLEIQEKIDIVNVFRRPEFVDEIVDEAIQLKVPAIWMQEEVINEAAANKARQAGIFVVMDRCILKE